MWTLIYLNRRLKPDRHGRDKDPRFHPFICEASASWSYLMTPFTHFFFLPRYVGLYVCAFTCLFLTKMIVLGQDINKPVGPTRRWLVIKVTAFLMRIFLLLYGICRWKARRASKVDYSKWLGPDWKPKYDGAGMFVSNHSFFPDAFLLFIFADPMPGFVAKEGVKVIPAVGFIASAVQSIFMHRQTADKNDKKRLMQQILERQEQAEKGEMPPLLIYPEGCTTNGKYIIKFKKGAFAALKPVKPIVFNYSGLRCSPCMGDPLNVWHYSVILFQCVLVQAELIEMPVFEPN